MSDNESVIGKWDSYYKDWPKGTIGRFGDSLTYQLAYQWLKDCAFIEDWGCGRGFFQSLCNPGQCKGLDCSCTPWADECVDLTIYKSKVPGIMMRGVLEHNYEWEKVLRNALASFTDRMVLVLFTPFKEKQTDVWPSPDGPCFSFAKEQIDSILKTSGAKWRFEGNLPTDSMFKIEHIYYLWK